MKNIIKSVLAATILSSCAWAVVHHEPIPLTRVLPGQDLNAFWYPNEYALDRQKHVWFEGNGAVADLGAGQSLVITFDWRDMTGQEFFSQPITVSLNPITVTPIKVDYWIPICPPEVSIHFAYQGLSVGGGALVEGIFSHECVIPEPHEYALLAGLGLVGFGAYRRMRKA